LKEKTIYCDTDSVIYIQKYEQSPAVTCGDMLENELGPEEHIDVFVSGDTKNYAYRTVNSRTKKKTVCKVRGITLVMPRLSSSILTSLLT
jgi:hypothetical protein